MADDEEEVVFKDSELHKYLCASNFVNLNPDINIAVDFVTSNVRDEQCNLKYNKEEDNAICAKQCRINISDYRANVIDLILKTGLVYPDHLYDIENVIVVENIRSERVRDSKQIVMYLSFIVGLVCGVKFTTSKILKTVLQIGVGVVSSLTVSKMIQFKKKFDQTKTIEDFAESIEHFFLLSRKISNYIVESEMVLRSKIMKPQPFYSPEVGWTNSGLSESVIKSGLFLPELRKVFYDVLKDVSCNFSSTCKYMRTILCFLPGVDNDGYYVCLPNDDDVSQIQPVVPTLEELKKVNNQYLLTQSECLRRLIFSFVKEFWDDKDCMNLKHIMKRLFHLTHSIKLQTKELERIFKTTTVSIAQSCPNVQKNIALKSQHINDKLYIFVQKFLNKSDAQLLSLLNDLRMIDGWMGDRARNVQLVTSSSDSIALLSILQERLASVKSDIDSFSCCYNDTLAVLQNMACNQTADDLHDVPYIEPSEHDVKKTGIEVGKSDFNLNSGDEIFVSLSGPDGSIDVFSDNTDVEEVQKPLPKSVLLELKCALQGKREEWIEREKKALGTTSAGDGLDLDTLTEPNKVSERVQASLDVEPKIKNLNRRLENPYYNSSDDSSTEQLIFNEGVRIPLLPVSKYEDSLETRTSSSLSSGLATETNATPACLPRSFTDQIKLAQGKFNLHMKEEEFINEIFDPS